MIAVIDEAEIERLVRQSCEESGVPIEVSDEAALRLMASLIRERGEAAA